MQTFLMITQVFLSVLLILSILTQQRGTGLSVTFGGQGGAFTSKRGIEKFLHLATIIFAVLFVLNALAFLFV